MHIKNVLPINFLFYRTETTINQLANFIPVGQELFKEAINNGLFITGCVHWHYIGFTGNEQSPFTLEISLPIAEVPNGYDGKFHTKRTENFRCVSILHEGGWLTIPESYAKIMKFVTDNQLQATAVNREIYINTDFNNAEANFTEIQLGIS